MSELSMFDVLGPNMIGPSSSHTAGACRIGKVGNKMSKGDISYVRFYLHGSFGQTYKGHGTDRALVGGILGFDPDDERIVESFSIAKDVGIRFEFIKEDLGDVHSNTVKIVIEKCSGETVEIMGSSIGGGNIIITRINGLDLEFTGEYFTLVVPHIDRPGIVTKVTAALAKHEINIAFMKVYRHNRGKEAFMIIESDNVVDQETMDEIKTLDGVMNTYSINLK